MASPGMMALWFNWKRQLQTLQDEYARLEREYDEIYVSLPYDNPEDQSDAEWAMLYRRQQMKDIMELRREIENNLISSGCPGWGAS